MVSDHTQAEDNLKTAAATSNVNLPTTLDAKDQAVYDRLAKLTGEAFDRAYARDMVRDHRGDLIEFRHEANDGKDAALKTFPSTRCPHWNSPEARARNVPQRLRPRDERQQESQRVSCSTTPIKSPADRSAPAFVPSKAGAFLELARVRAEQSAALGRDARCNQAGSGRSWTQLGACVALFRAGAGNRVVIAVGEGRDLGSSRRPVERRISRCGGLGRVIGSRKCWRVAVHVCRGVMQTCSFPPRTRDLFGLATVSRYGSHSSGPICRPAGCERAWQHQPA